MSGVGGWAPVGVIIRLAYTKSAVRVRLLPKRVDVCLRISGVGELKGRRVC